MGKVSQQLTSLKNLFQKRSRITYSQFGEDMIIDYFFKKINVKFPSYLDIGANDPIKGNNTYRLFLNGSRGTLVEPNPDITLSLQNQRKGDKILNVGISNSQATHLPFYILKDPYNALSTFSKEEVDVIKRDRGIEVKKVVDVAMANINTVIAQNFENCPDLISIDVEGLDFEILSSLNFQQYRPKLFCVETMRFGMSKKPERHDAIFDLFEEQGYTQYASTFYNSLFCPNEIINLTIDEF